jgi:hypothetical protein
VHDSRFPPESEILKNLIEKSIPTAKSINIPPIKKIFIQPNDSEALRTTCSFLAINPPLSTIVRDFRDFRDFHGWSDLSDLSGLNDFRDFRGWSDLSGFRDFRGLNGLSGLNDWSDWNGLNDWNDLHEKNVLLLFHSEKEYQLPKLKKSPFQPFLKVDKF